MSKYKTKDVIMGWFFLGLFAGLGFYFGRVTSEPSNVPVKQMIDGNSKIIHSVGVTGSMQTVCIDLITEIKEELRSDDQKLDIKPHKSREKAIWKLYEEFTPDDDVPETYEQILTDQREIDQSVRALGFGHIFMEEALGQILEKIKESHLTNEQP
tara:strand:- start:1096 stop:1560 length:465 start_codon:yes stop_codon:yes gene_type:complete